MVEYFIKHYKSYAEAYEYALYLDEFCSEVFITPVKDGALCCWRDYV